MGLLVEYSCPACGYGADAQADIGFAGVAYEAMACLGCREVVSVPVGVAEEPFASFANGEEPPELGVCPACRRPTELRRLALPAGPREPSAKDVCPRCGEEALVASAAGIWD